MPNMISNQENEKLNPQNKLYIHGKHFLNLTISRINGNKKQ